jgi:hypothetical protein
MLAGIFVVLCMCAQIRDGATYASCPLACRLDTVYLGVVPFRMTVPQRVTEIRYLVLV